MFIVVPAYNEERQIRAVVRALCTAYPEAQVVVVNDGSIDATARHAAAAGATVLTHIVNRGQGAALMTGTAFARANGAEYVVHFDGDGQFDPRDIKTAHAALVASGADVVFGSRFLSSASAARIPFLKRRVLLPVARWINRLFTGVRLTDAHNGFRILNRRAADLLSITQDRMAHNSEIVHWVRHAGLRWVEVPVSVSYAEFGQGIGGGMVIIKDLLLHKIL